MKSEEQIRILLLEDDFDDYRLFEKKLRDHEQDFEITWVDTLSKAIQELTSATYDVILSDLSLPDSSGTPTITSLNDVRDNVPIIVFTSLEDDDVEKNLIEAGAQDYLVKGELDGRDMAKAILHAVQRQRSSNRIRSLVKKLKRNRRQLKQQALLLKRKNRRLKRLYHTAQEFVDNVSHDFRTPLTVIKDYVSLLTEGMAGEISDEQKGMLATVGVRADDLNNMVDDLLDVSKLDAGLLGAWRREVSTQEIIERTLPLLEQRAKVRSTHLHCLPIEVKNSVFCDADKVGRVITNLVVNAIKYSGKNGEVTLSATELEDEKKVVIRVSDTGPGIPPDKVDEIFNRFRQLEMRENLSSKGFGLGLSIAKQLCDLNLGELRIESTGPDGTTFAFDLPFADPQELIRRWTLLHANAKEPAQLVEISVSDESPDADVNDFDLYLNCLLRSDDLLVRINRSTWYLVMIIAVEDITSWTQRARLEWAAHNRNRPDGPLPVFSANRLKGWWLNNGVDGILSDIQRLLLEQGPTEKLCAVASGSGGF